MKVQDERLDLSHERTLLLKLNHEDVGDEEEWNDQWCQMLQRDPVDKLTNGCNFSLTHCFDKNGHERQAKWIQLSDA